MQQLYVSEPATLKANVATKTLWSLYAMDYRNEEMLKVLSSSIEKHHTEIPMDEVVGSIQAFAHFNYLNLPARDGLVKTTIRNSQEYSFKALASICESLARLNYENHTLLQIVKKQLLTYENRDALGMLVDNSSAYPNALGPAGMEPNYLRPTQISQLMFAFSHAQIYDIDVWNLLETLLVWQIDQASPAVLVRAFQSHSKLTEHVLVSKESTSKQPPRVLRTF